MSQRPDGSHRCDRCDRGVGNGDVQTAAKIVTMHPDRPGELLTLHLCREPRQGAPRGCEGNVLGPATLAAWPESRSA